MSKKVITIFSKAIEEGKAATILRDDAISIFTQIVLKSITTQNQVAGNKKDKIVTSVMTQIETDDFRNTFWQNQLDLFIARKRKTLGSAERN